MGDCPWGFDSPPRHHQKFKRLGGLPRAAFLFLGICPFIVQPGAEPSAAESVCPPSGLRRRHTRARKEPLGLDGERSFQMVKDEVSLPALFLLS